MPAYSRPEDEQVLAHQERLKQGWNAIKSYLGGFTGKRDPWDTSAARTAGEISTLIPDLIMLGMAVPPSRVATWSSGSAKALNALTKRIAPGRPVFRQQAPKATDVDVIPGERLFKEPRAHPGAGGLTPQQEDLRQAGLEAVTKMAARPEVTEESFARLAYPTAKGAMLRLHGETGGQAGLPEGLRQQMRLVNRFDEEWNKLYGRTPSPYVLKAAVKTSRFKDQYGSLGNLPADEIERLRAGVGRERIFGINPGVPETGIDIAVGQALEPGEQGVSSEGTLAFLRNLPPGQQRIAEKIYVEGMGTREAARALGISHPTVIEARKAISTKLDKLRGGPPPISGGGGRELLSTEQQAAEAIQEYMSPEATRARLEPRLQAAPERDYGRLPPRPSLDELRARNLELQKELSQINRNRGPNAGGNRLRESVPLPMPSPEEIQEIVRTSPRTPKGSEGHKKRNPPPDISGGSGRGYGPGEPDPDILRQLEAAGQHQNPSITPEGTRNLTDMRAGQDIQEARWASGGAEHLETLPDMPYVQSSANPRTPTVTPFMSIKTEQWNPNQPITASPWGQHYALGGPKPAPDPQRALWDAFKRYFGVE